MNKFKQMIAVVLLGIPAIAASSSFTGKTQFIRIDPSNSARVSIIIAGTRTTTCPNNTVFAYNNAGTGVGLLWTQALINANNLGRTLFIQGNGVCDSTSIEGVSFIDFK
jgi:hypothetical protein